MKRIFLSFFFFLVFSLAIQVVSGTYRLSAYAINGTTYYVAQTAAGLGDGSSYANRQSVATHNADTYAPDDVIYLCDTITSPVIPPSSGTAGHPIIYRGDYPNHVLTLNVNTSSYLVRSMDFYGKSYITFTNTNARPVIDGQITSGSINETAPVNTCIRVANANNIVLNNIEIKNGWTGISGDGASDITITKIYGHQLRVHGVHFINTNRLIIGGSAANANEWYQCTYKTAWGTNVIGADIRVYQSTDVVISYNHCHGTTGNSRDGWGMSGIMSYGVNRCIIEYNTIHDHGAYNGRGSIHLKSPGYYQGQYVVVRFNNIYDNWDDEGWDYTDSDGIQISRNNHNIYVYGNRIHNCGGGISLENSWESGGTDGTDGRHIYDIYVWSNIIDDVDHIGLGVVDGWSGNTDDFYNIFFVNNSVYKALGQAESVSYYAGITAWLDSSTIGSGSAPYLTVKNNIISESRFGQTSKFSLYSNEKTAARQAIDYNLQYDSTNNPFHVRIGSSGDSCYNAPCDYSSANVPAGWMDNDISANPLFTDPANGDLTLQTGSPAIDAGTAITAVIPTFSMPFYSGSLAFDFADVLNPAETDWSTISPTISVAKQGDNGSDWERGAYMYIESEPEPEPEPEPDIVPTIPLAAPEGVRVE